MKTITIHGLDEGLARLIKKIAENEGWSLNKTIKRLLEKALGVGVKKRKNYREDFTDLFGTWSESDLTEFNDATSDFEKIDSNDWQ